MRLGPRPGELIDRDTTVTFRFEGRPVRGFAGDSIGSALYADGRRRFSRSFKYHRPRGLLCCAGRCANCLMTVDGVPNVRVCVEPARDVRAEVDVGGELALRGRSRRPPRHLALVAELLDAPRPAGRALEHEGHLRPPAGCV